MQQIFSTGQVARMLGIRPHQIEYALSSRQLLEPALRFAGKRVFTEKDVQRAASYFGRDLEDGLIGRRSGEDVSSNDTPAC